MPKYGWAWVASAALLAIATGNCGTAAAEPLAVLPAASAPSNRLSTRFAIDNWQTDEGLPQTSVTSILQTRDGYLWFGTLNGLVRFDGVRFAVFDESNTPELKSSRVLRLYEDREGGLWVGTATGGIVRIRDGQATAFAIGQGVSSQHLASFCQDATGAIWLYTSDGQLWQYANERFTVFSFGLGQTGGCRAVLAESDGSLWIGADGRLSALGPAPAPGPLEHQVQQDVPLEKLDCLLASQSGGHWRLADHRIRKFRGNRLEQDLGEYPWNRRLAVGAACEDRQGNLLVGTLGGGLYWFDRAGVAVRITSNEGLSSDIILSLCVDAEGNLWVGTDGGGLNRVRRQVFEVLDERGGLPASVVQSVSEDPRGGLWIGSNGGGVAHWQEGAMQRFGPSQGLTNTHVWAVLVDRNQQLWAATWGGGVFQFDGTRFQPAPGAASLPPVAMALHEDRTGNLWVGTQGGLARRSGGQWRLFTTADGLAANEVRAIADDPEGNLWVGTLGGGLLRLRDGQFQVQAGLPSKDISSLYVDAEGVLWIGTFGSGLARLQAGRLTRYTRNEGLVSNSIGHLLEDGRGYLWIGSSAGLMRARKRELEDFARGLGTFIHCRAYARPDGLPTRECTIGSQPGACRTRDGRLWFPTVKGLGSVQPALLNQNPHPPPVFIESVLIDGQPQNTNALRLPFPATLVIPSGRERVEFFYTSLSLSAPDRGRFKYRLEGLETSWVEVGSSRTVGYSRLPPGPYRFQVTACNEDGVWNETGASVGLTVLPPLWRTWWFLSLAGTGLLGAITGIVHRVSTQKLQRQLVQVKQEEALEKERSRIARDIHDQLGANLTQITLVSELAQADKESPQDVEAHAQQISQTARNMTRALDEIVWAVNPTNDTLDGLMTYICKYAQEYLSVAGLRCRLDVPAELPDAAIPPEVRHNVFLAFKESVTNVVRHAAASVVWIRLRLTQSSFTLEIEDNGRGLAATSEPAARARNGLRNMQKRLEDVSGHFTITGTSGGGTLVCLTVPLGGR